MRYILAVTLLTTFAAAQLQQPTPGPPKPASTTSPDPAREQPQPAADYEMQIQLRNQATFTPVPSITRTTFSNYAPPPQLTPLHQTADDFSSTAGYPLGAAMAREILMHRAKSFAKKFCKTYGSGAAWWYQSGNGAYRGRVRVE